MRIRVYQVDGEKDRLGLKFRDYNTALKKAGRIDPSIYRTVYDGQADCRVEQVRQGDEYGIQKNEF